jgi:ribosomal protein S27AE
MRRFTCPKCGHTWKTSWFKWVLTSPAHWFRFGQYKKAYDFRDTKCPSCKERSFINGIKIKKVK